MLHKILAVVLVLFLIAAVVPSAITTFIGVDTAAWTGAFAPLAALWPLFAILSFVVLLIMIADAVKSGNIDF